MIVRLIVVTFFSMVLALSLGMNLFGGIVTFLVGLALTNED